jgi:hypothetical protein
MNELVLAFILTVYIDEAPQPNPSAFYDINRCQYFARRIRQQNADYRHRKYPAPLISATCTPLLIDSKKRLIWK